MVSASEQTFGEHKELVSSESETRHVWVERQTAVGAVYRINTDATVVHPSKQEKIRNKLENCYFKDTAFSAHIPQKTLDLLGPEYAGAEPSNELLRRLSGDKRVTKLLNIHGWNSRKEVFELESSEESFTDEELRKCLAKDRPVIVINVDVAGWGETELTDAGLDGLKLGKEGFLTARSMRLDMERYQGLVDSTEDTELQKKYSELYEEIMRPKSQESIGLAGFMSDARKILTGEPTHTMNSEKVETLVKEFAELLLGEDIIYFDLKIDIHNDEHRKIFERINMGYKGSLSLLCKSLLRKNKEYRQGDENWDIASLSSESVSIVGSMAPTSANKSADALRVLVDDALGIQGTTAFVPHSQGERIVNLFQRADWYYGSNNLERTEVVVGIAGALTDRPLAQESNNHLLFEMLRGRTGRLAVLIGQQFGLRDRASLAAILGALTTMQLALKGLPWKVQNEIARQHGSQIDSKHLAPFTFQSFQWGTPDSATGAKFNTISIRGDKDTLVPNEPYLGWLDTFATWQSKKPPEQMLFIEPRLFVQTLPGSHYVQAEQENQSAIIDTLVNTIENVDAVIVDTAWQRLLDAREDSANMLRDHQAIGRLQFCATSRERMDQSLSERITKALSIIIECDAHKSKMTVAVPVTHDELIAISEYFAHHRKHTSFGHEAPLANKLMKHKDQLVANVHAEPHQLKSLVGTIQQFPFSLVLQEFRRINGESRRSTDELITQCMWEFSRWLSRKISGSRHFQSPSELPERPRNSDDDLSDKPVFSEGALDTIMLLVREYLEQNIPAFLEHTQVPSSEESIALEEFLLQ